MTETRETKFWVFTTCYCFYFTTHFSLLTVARKLLLNTDDLCTLNSVLILAYSFAFQFAAYLNTRPTCFGLQKGISGSEPVFHGNMFCYSKHQWFRHISIFDTAEKKCLEWGNLSFFSALLMLWERNGKASGWEKAMIGFSPIACD